MTDGEYDFIGERRFQVTHQGVRVAVVEIGRRLVQYEHGGPAQQLSSNREADQFAGGKPVSVLADGFVQTRGQLGGSHAFQRRRRVGPGNSAAQIFQQRAGKKLRRLTDVADFSPQIAQMTALRLHAVVKNRSALLDIEP